MRIALVAVVASCARLVSPLLLLQLLSVSSLLTAFRASSLPSGLICTRIGLHNAHTVGHRYSKNAFKIYYIERVQL